jgi:PadR family transcriptional regulator, regulatory protein PadR
LHGYAIAQLIQQLSDDLLRVEEGSLYPALQRLELNGGRKQLAEESARYRLVTGAVARIMGFA